MKFQTEMWSHRRTILGSLFSEQIFKKQFFLSVKNILKETYYAPFYNM